MKNVIISVVGVLIILVCGVYYGTNSDTVENKEYLRIHIRADSNDEIAQNVKYKVRDRVVEYLTPFIADCDTKQKAQDMLKSNLKNIERISDEVLRENGFLYTSNAHINNEKFPTRVYDGLTLESGFYDALIINLGSGKGDNWWCVVYPPLCFTSGRNVVIKSKIKEIIDNFFALHNNFKG